MIIDICALVIFGVLASSFVWWAIRRFGGAPMTDEERNVESTQGRMRPSVFEGGAGYLPGEFKR